MHLDPLAAEDTLVKPLIFIDGKDQSRRDGTLIVPVVAAYRNPEGVILGNPFKKTQSWENVPAILFRPFGLVLVCLRVSHR